MCNLFKIYICPGRNFIDVSSGIVFGLRVSGGIGGGVGLEILFGRRDIYFGIIVGGLGGMRLLC